MGRNQFFWFGVRARAQTTPIDSASQTVITKVISQRNHRFSSKSPFFRHGRNPASVQCCTARFSRGGAARAKSRKPKAKKHQRAKEPKSQKPKAKKAKSQKAPGRSRRRRGVGKLDSAEAARDHLRKFPGWAATRAQTPQPPMMMEKFT